MSEPTSFTSERLSLLCTPNPGPRPLDPIKKSGHAAFFDVDGTLLPSPSTERRFLRWLLDRRIIGPRHLLRSALSLLIDLPWTAEKFKANKTYLHGESVERFHHLGAEFVAAAIVPIIRRSAREVIDRHRRSGDRIILLTGTLDLLAEPLARALTIDDVVCGRLERADGGFTGRTIPPHPYGEGKAVALRDYAQRTGIDLQRIRIYGDGWSDLPAFKLAGRAIVINPTPRLERFAQRQGWTVARWDDARH
jgi:HAD superfamily hydrolase (TIGR01490 family)